VEQKRNLPRNPATASPLTVSSKICLLVAGLLCVEKLPLPSLAFLGNCPCKTNNLETRIRIRTDSLCKSSGWRKRETIGTSTGNLLSCRSTKLATTGLRMENGKNADDATDGWEADFEETILSYDEDEDLDLDDKQLLKKQLAHLENMEKMLEEIEDYCSIEGMCEDDEEIMIIDGDDTDMFMGDVGDELEDMESLLEYLEENASEEERQDLDEGTNDEVLAALAVNATESAVASGEGAADTAATFSPRGLEEALLQGVVPVDAGVGSNTLPGDFGFDPFGFAEKDYVLNFQYRFLDAIPGGNPGGDPPPEPRPSALVLRDYREAEIRHGRLAMMAVVIWPIQEKLDQLLLDPSDSGPLLYGPVTLPYLPLFMTLVMMLLGYLDIYAKDIQEEEGVGDAFLPGDCFWDPLKMLDGAPASMKRNMQERELFNGRVAMMAFAAFVFEEATSHEAVIDIPGNEVLFVPAYQIPSVQEWLDAQFLIYAS